MEINFTLILASIVSINYAAILDYSTSRYIPIADGHVAIFDGYGALAHVTDLLNFTTIAEETKNLTNLLPKSHMRKLLESDVDQMQKAIESLRIHHRHARSINILGTALKYVAGTPDYDDITEVYGKQNELIEANNAQLIINTEIQSRINNLTKIVNTLVKEIKTSEIDSGYLYSLLSERNREVIRELDNIALSMALGRMQIINPILLDNSEIDFILKSEGYSGISVSEIIVNSKLKILQSENIIKFLIKFPRIIKFCDKKLILPVVHNNMTLAFETNDVAKCDLKYIMLKNCKRRSITSFCEMLSHKNISCLKNLLNNNTAACSTSSAHDIQPFVEVDDGIVIINNQPSKIVSESLEKYLSRGTYLITFDNTLTVNSTEFKNFRRIAFKSPEVPVAHTVNLTDHTTILSLPYLNELNINNRNEIAHIHFKVRGVFYTSTSLFMLIFIYCAWSLLMKRRKKIQINNVIRDIEQTGTSPS